MRGVVHSITGGRASEGVAVDASWRARRGLRRWGEWFVILGAVDVLLTWCVMQLGAEEANRVAAAVVRQFGPMGLVMTKLVAIAGVLAMSELVARRNASMARWILVLAVAVSVVPVVVGVSTFLEVRWYATMPEYWAMLWWGVDALH